jgi:hypothetical protein
MTGYYKVADFCFAVTLLADRDLAVLLPSFCPFMWESGEEKLFELNETSSLPERLEAVLIDEDRNDMGHTCVFRIEDGYRVELRYVREDLVHVFETNADFTKVSAVICWEDRYAPVALSSMLRIVFSQAIIPHDAVSMHASVVVKDGKAVLFMGKSGTGKSTHTRLWLEHIPGSSLLNDDNPIVRVISDKVIAYGSPWSGKTPCYKNESAPAVGFVRLRQAPYNKYVPCEDIAAFKALLPGSSILRQDKTLHSILCGTLIEIAGLAKVGEMECLPDRDAAETCYKSVCK